MSDALTWENVRLGMVGAIVAFEADAQKRFGQTDARGMTYDQRRTFFTVQDSFMRGATARLPTHWGTGVPTTEYFTNLFNTAEEITARFSAGVKLIAPTVFEPRTGSPFFVVPPAEWTAYRAILGLMTGGILVPVERSLSGTYGVAWNSTYDNAILWRVAMSYAEEFGDALRVQEPPVFSTAGGWRETSEQVRAINAYNRAQYRDALIVQGKVLTAGGSVTPVVPPYKRPRIRETESQFEKVLSVLGPGIAVLMGGAMAWSAVGGWAGIKSAANNAWQSIVKQVTQPIEAIKTAATDPVGAVQSAAQQQVKKEIARVVGPAGRVYEIVSDPAGFIRDKITDQVLYPLQNPQDWVLDQSGKYLRNKVNGELRDLITGALIPQKVVAVQQSDQTVAVAVPTVDSTARPTGKSGWAIPAAIAAALFLLG